MVAVIGVTAVTVGVVAVAVVVAVCVADVADIAGVVDVVGGVGVAVLGTEAVNPCEALLPPLQERASSRQQEQVVQHQQLQVDIHLPGMPKIVAERD